ncbi:hypothetical protein QFC24_006254 [Naganishia onofrii]|uniref:Uncharacterized protein n=1 Tax=Naganishia onofrii TaxID=1851511 RepID=A0ACC2X4Z9_9TREE|nr:hypothetical protein QFC24_006254 [Naganishia onofrii]
MEPSGSPSTAPEKVLDCNLVALWNNILDDLTELSRRDPMRARADIHNLLNARHAAPAPYYNARLHGLLCCVNFELKEYNLAAFQCDIAGHILESCDMRDVQEENVHAWDDVVEFILDSPNGDIIDLGVYHRDDDATIQEGQEGMQGSD